MINSIVVMGRFTRDPELRYTTNNTPVATACIAVDRLPGPDGNREADFFNVVAWKQKGEFLAKYFRKGSKCCIQGRLQSRQYQDRDGNNRFMVEIVADNIEFAESKGSQSTTAEGCNAPDADIDRARPVSYDASDEQLPF